MKKILILFSVSLFVFASCTKKEESPFAKIIAVNQSHQSVNCKVSEKYYYSNGSDTTVTPFEIWVARDNSDTLRHGYVWIDNYYRPYNMVYSAGEFFLTIPPKKTTVLYQQFTESFISPIDWIDFFLEPESLAALNDDPNISTDFSDTVFHEKVCSKMVLIFHNSNNKVVERQTFILDNKTSFPLWAQLESFKKDYVYTDELLFSNYKFDQVNIDILKGMHKELLAKNPVEREGSGSEAARLEKLLHVGDKAPLFSGRYFSSGKKFSILDYLGKKVIVVDFWYTHCPPCVRAMPYLSDLYKEYKDQGLIVLGLNSVDNQPHSMENLKSFLSKRAISYEVILTNPSVDISYKINGYPTMYVIDKEGKIAFVEMGFDKEKFEKLKQIIEKIRK